MLRRFHLLQQVSLQIHLVGVEHWLRVLVVRRHLRSHLLALTPSRIRRTVDLPSIEAFEVSLIKLVVFWEEGANLIGKPDLTEVLHGARILAIAFGKLASGLTNVEDSAVDTPMIEEESMA